VRGQPFFISATFLHSDLPLWLARLLTLAVITALCVVLEEPYAIGAGMLIVAAGDRGLPMDYDELERWTRIGFERGSAMRRGER
jgi:hypothetical protein